MNKSDWRTEEIIRLRLGIKFIRGALDKLDEAAALIRGDLALLRASIEEEDTGEEPSA